MRAERFFVADTGPGRADQTVVVEGKITAEGQLEIERLFSLDTPSLEALSHILRHRELWPKGFVWDFARCSNCAMGMADRLWSVMDHRNDQTYATAMKRSFGLPTDDTMALFTFSYHDTYPIDSNLVTPEMVADQIDKYLASR